MFASSRQYGAPQTHGTARSSVCPCKCAAHVAPGDFGTIPEAVRIAFHPPPACLQVQNLFTFNEGVREAGKMGQL